MLARTLARPLARPLVRAVSSSIGGSPWSPNRLGDNLLQYPKFEYHSSKMNGKPILKSLEKHGTHRQPRQGACIESGTSASILFVSAGSDGSKWVTYYNETTNTWVEHGEETGSPHITLSLPNNTKVRNIKLWTDNTYTTAQMQEEGPFNSLPSNLFAWYHCNEESSGALLYNCVGGAFAGIPTNCTFLDNQSDINVNAADRDWETKRIDLMAES